MARTNKMSGTGGFPNYLNMGNSAKKFSGNELTAPDNGFLSLSKKTIQLLPQHPVKKVKTK